jgi:hypothetical protein
MTPAPPLPPYASHELVQERLALIFPEGSPFRNYVIREISASTVFAMLYVGAVDGSGRHAAPKHVYRMSDEQADLTSDAARLAYAAETVKQGSLPRGKPWYADTTREPIRDETLRQGLISAGAAVEDRSVATTSSKPRYALARDFAALFRPDLAGDELALAVSAWRQAHLTAGALARVELLRARAVRDAASVEVEFPNGEGRLLSPGESSIITKRVIEEFAPRFLTNPFVLWLSESGNKVVARDEMLARRIGLEIDASKNLPDIILADVGPSEILLVFVEVVSTDGPVTEDRRRELLALATKSGLEEGHVAFLTAFMDRDEPAFRKAHASLAWNSFVWFASEPDGIEALVGHRASAVNKKLHDLLAGIASTPK